MATINDTYPTLLDYAKQMDPDGSIAQAVQMLSRLSPAIADAAFVEGNLPTGHVFTHQTGLPSLGWRMYNQGVAASKGKTDQITETCGMLAGRSAVDVELANLNGNAGAFRRQQDVAFMEAFKQEVETGLFYHSTKATPEKFHGLTPRLNLTTDPFGSQIVLCDSSPSGSDQTSIWLVYWGPESVFGIFPKGSSAGLALNDMGVQLVADSGGTNTFRAYVSEWTWKVGLAVKDARQLVRIANIDTSAISATGTNLIPAMIDAYHRINSHSVGRGVWYANRKIATYLHLQARAAVGSSTLSLDMVEGKMITNVMGLPVHITDALLNTEDVVS